VGDRTTQGLQELDDFVLTDTCAVLLHIEYGIPARVTPRRDAEEFAQFLMDIAVEYSDAKTIHLVMDNLSTHSCSSLVKSLGTRIGLALWQRFTAHYTPKHAS
jgi:DDE superfamily endonuclease